MTRKLPLTIVMLAAASLGFCQEGGELTLLGAIRLAKERNGNIRSAQLAYLSSLARVRQTSGLFLPTITPRFTYESNRGEVFTGRGNPNNFTGDAASISGSWRILDSGERQWQLFGDRRFAEAQALNSLQTLRSVLFTVIQQYYGVIRAEQLLRVQEAQLTRAETIYEQTRTQVEVGEVARITLLQAEADRLNARASALLATNSVSFSEASLKATIGWDIHRELPELQAEPDPRLQPLDFTLAEAIDRGLANRPDLNAQIKVVEAAQSDVRLAEIAGGVQWSVDVGADYSVAPNVTTARGITLGVTMPLFDGMRSREAIRIARYSYQREVENLNQIRRNAAAEIEAAYKEYESNVLILEATAAAREAATRNFEAAAESQRLGGADLVTVLTAQVSLATAESNYVEAVFDALVTAASLRLVMGEPLPGETS